MSREIKREEVLRVYLTPEEKAKAKLLAANEGLTVSTYLRRCILMALTPKKAA